MKPTFKNTLDWEQAQLLMQPAFIRVVDNIRKQLDRSHWQGTYQEIQEPFPGYQLCLTLQERSVMVNIWDLCFHVCFLNYEPSLDDERDRVVEIDLSLMDETGEIDWQRLETKTQRIVQLIFANLPVS